ncbi:MAG: cation:proton antiporter [Bacteroidetes bacterium]|nr:cation:proton antiporter [Bacteroidota bacterium]
MPDILFPLSVMCLVILSMMLILRRWSQPYLVAYILAGLMLGPQVTGIFEEPAAIEMLGQIGVLLLMFFLGMEIEIPDNRSLLTQPLIAQTIKTVLSAGAAMLAGYVLDWGIGNRILFGVLLLFNSTAVVTDMLRRNGELNSTMGMIVLNMLLLQDVLAGPVFAAMQVGAGHEIEWVRLTFSLGCCGLLFLLLSSIRNRRLFQWQAVRGLEEDHDLQVFLGVFVCLGFALLASGTGLPASLGSFGAGLYLGRTRGFHWLGDTLRPFRVFFVALFFVSVGLRLDPHYIGGHWPVVAALTFGVLVINSLLSAFVFRLMGYRWMEAFHTGALLSQTGEFGLIACSIAFEAGIVPGSFYKTCVAVTGLALLLSTGWVSVLHRFIYRGDIGKITIENV